MKPAVSQSHVGGRLSLVRIASLAAWCVLVIAGATPIALGQDVGGSVGADDPAASGQLFLEADQLVYDFDKGVVTAIGNVSITRAGTTVDADRIAYDQKAGTLTASGGVRILEPNGNVITSERVALTDDLRNGFVSGLGIVTPDRARFSAATAERTGDRLILRKGVYTACEPCRERPGRPPLWQIKAARIVHDQSDQMIYYRDARLEFLGVPIAWTPVLFHPDPTAKRKTGFLAPTFLGTDATGYGFAAPFFYNAAPNYDVTFAPAVLDRQGLLLQGEWRHRVANGTYSVRFSGIRQLDKDAFIDDDGEELSGYREWRGSAASHGRFDLNERWNYGWDLNATSDRTFNRDYRIPDATAQDLVNTVFLTGRSERNYFDLRALHFLVQREDTDEDLSGGGIYTHDDQGEQAIVLPLIDHNYVFDRALLGGELRLDSNFASIARDESDIRHPPAPFADYYAGVAGSYTRASSRASWRRRLIVPGGQVVTPFAYLQADANFLSTDDDAADLSSDEFLARAMPAVGVEYEWPILATLGPTIHTFGPRAQLIARPDERFAGDLPNEDAQSLVFDDTNLFAWDKFSGYDRQEGGTRANVGLAYQGLFPGGASVDALVGQAFQVAGFNSYEVLDSALTGIGSGLDGDDSDYVSRLTVNTGTGLSVTARGRFDNETLDLNRGEVNAIGGYGRNLLSVGYATIRQSPSSGVFRDREEVNGAASLALTEQWSALGAIIYDIKNSSLVSQSVGLAFDNECVNLSAVYSETPDRYSDLVVDREVFVRLSLKTLGGSSLKSQLDSGGD